MVICDDGLLVSQSVISPSSCAVDLTSRDKEIGSQRIKWTVWRTEKPTYWLRPSGTLASLGPNTQTDLNPSYLHDFFNQNSSDEKHFVPFVWCLSGEETGKTSERRWAAVSVTLHSPVFEGQPWHCLKVIWTHAGEEIGGVFVSVPSTQTTEQNCTKVKREKKERFLRNPAYSWVFYHRGPSTNIAT